MIRQSWMSAAMTASASAGKLKALPEYLPKTDTAPPESSGSPETDQL
jgi:hypothetical protein